MGADGETELPALDPAGLPSVGENERTELSLPVLEPAGLPSVGEDGFAAELELTSDSPAGTTGVEAELGPLLPAAVDDATGEDEVDAGPDAGRLGVAPPYEAAEEEAAGPEPVGLTSEEAEAEEAEALAELVTGD